MHRGRFHTDRSARRVGGSGDQGIPNNRMEDNAPISRGNYRRGETSVRESISSVGEGYGERIVNREEGQEQNMNARTDSVASSSNRHSHNGVRVNSARLSQEG